MMIRSYVRVDVDVDANVCKFSKFIAPSNVQCSRLEPLLSFVCDLPVCGLRIGFADLRICGFADLRICGFDSAPRRGRGRGWIDREFATQFKSQFRRLGRWLLERELDWIGF